jgi:hypothetical protein
MQKNNDMNKDFNIEITNFYWNESDFFSYITKFGWTFYNFCCAFY